METLSGVVFMSGLEISAGSGPLPFTFYRSPFTPYRDLPHAFKQADRRRCRDVERFGAAGHRNGDDGVRGGGEFR